MATAAETQAQIDEKLAKIAELKAKRDKLDAAYNIADDKASAARDAADAAYGTSNYDNLEKIADAAAQAAMAAHTAVAEATAQISDLAGQIEVLQGQETKEIAAENKKEQEKEITVDPAQDQTVSKDEQGLIDKRAALEAANKQAIANGDRALSDSIIDQINAIDAQLEKIDPEYRPPGISVDAGGDAETKKDTSSNPSDPPIIQPLQEAVMGPQAKDWRFRMSLSPRADYLYKADDPGILAPLLSTDGVIFPYTPSINIVYSAGYNAQDITHSNYKIYTYKSSAVEAIQIAGDFTAQDSVEANYLLAVIHFFKSVTKMFYGQDQNPSRGTPPPLVYLRGFGQYQFDWHPVAITSFTHTFPQDVDYVDAYPTNNGLSIGSLNLSPYEYERNKSGLYSESSRQRALFRNMQPGGLPANPVFSSTQNINESTRVPTKVTIQLTCIPIVTRNAISNKFSLKEYATGKLMKGSTNAGTGGGIW